jgi:bifunctional DNA-binding transcriptional regulator/antitoxin component of YhaV-PrlF toxin-antitoxin module
MGDKVKNDVDGQPRRRRDDRTHISAKHQVTIPIDAFVDAGFEPGDVVRAEVVGPGRVVLTRQDELLEEFSGSLHTGGSLRQAVDDLRNEWA